MECVGPAFSFFFFKLTDSLIQRVISVLANSGSRQTNTWICFSVVASLIFDYACKYSTGFTLMVFQVIMVSVFVTSGVEFE